MSSRSGSPPSRLPCATPTAMSSPRSRPPARAPASPGSRPARPGTCSCRRPPTSPPGSAGANTASTPSHARRAGGRSWYKVPHRAPSCSIGNSARRRSLQRGACHGFRPHQASVVVVGAGIVGNSLVHHLAELGWKDIVQVDKGPLPDPGGSTGHASNFIFPVDHSREITDLTLDSMRQYKELGVFTESGGFEVARTEERMQELARRMASARAWGIESQLVTP